MSCSSAACRCPGSLGRGLSLHDLRWKLPPLFGRFLGPDRGKAEANVGSERQRGLRLPASRRVSHAREQLIKKCVFLIRFCRQSTFKPFAAVPHLS
jgi:hypothetical protein